MTTKTWNNGAAGSYDSGDWSGGIAPVPGDTAVISSAGDPAPTAGGGISGEIFSPLSFGGSSVNFFPVGVLIDNGAGTFTPVVITEPDDQTILVDFPSHAPPESQIPLGDTIINETIDFEGAGSFTAATLQRTTFAATTTLNISGTSIFDDHYDNRLNGTINIGTPFSVDGIPVSAPPANANGFNNELDIELEGDGSWVPGGDNFELSGYIPTTTNDGTITVANASAFRIDAFVTAGGAAIAGGSGPVAPPDQANFDNEGSIFVQAGGQFGFYNTTSIYYVPTPGIDQGWGDIPAFTILSAFINNGQILLQGAQGFTTTGTIWGDVSGTGTITVDGGNETDPSQTSFTFNGAAVDNTLLLRNATINWLAGSGINGGNNGFRGGSIETNVQASLTFEDAHGILNVEGFDGALQPPYPMQINGFRAGDQINLDLSITGELGIDTALLSYRFANGYPVVFTPVWDQASHALSIDATYKSSSGFPQPILTSTPVAFFTLNGTYDPNSFQIAILQEGKKLNFGEEFTIQITTSQSVQCFAAGTAIAVADGERPIETLRIGDLIRTTNGALRPIRWIGHRHIDLTRHPEPSLVLPIRIRANAFAPGVPHHDLLVSPDHALFVDDMLIPARLLLNGATVVRDTGHAAITYFHLELDSHDILLAENLPAETYLATGSRSLFDNATVVDLCPDFTAAEAQRQRETRSCAPFVADATRVKSIWQPLADRAHQTGHRLPQPAVIHDPDLRLAVAGRSIRPITTTQGQHTFPLPRRAGPVRLLSRASAPCDVTPWVEDRRQLGVMVQRIRIADRSGWHDLPLDHPSLTDGWWKAEQNDATMWRWTDGEAAFLLPPGATALQITLGAGMSYLAPTPQALATQALAA